MILIIFLILSDLAMTYSGCKTDTIYICNTLMCILYEMEKGGK